MNAQSTITLRSGHKMPVIGLGSWQLDDHTIDSVMQALQLGLRMVDTSGDYGTQPGVGEGIRKSGFGREMIYIVTKVEETDDAYKATKQDLEELGFNSANLMLIHRPPARGFGQELWQGLLRAKQEGLTKDIGVSNYSIEQIQALYDATGEMPVVNQIEWTPFGHSKEMLGYCQENGIIIQAYSPLTRGERLDDPDLMDIAEHHRKTPSQILIRWNIEHGTVPIVKASSLEHLQEDIDVFDFELSSEEMQMLDALNEEYSALGPSLSYIKH